MLSSDSPKSDQVLPWSGRAVQVTATMHKLQVLGTVGLGLL